jgi:hypothetical protein
MTVAEAAGLRGQRKGNKLAAQLVLAAVDRE